MEQVRTNWLQKAVAIVAGIVLAACLAVGFAPAKAWAEEATMTYPNGQTWTKGSTTSIIFAPESEYEMDGGLWNKDTDPAEAVPSTYYECGGTHNNVVTLKASYLEQLSVGEHHFLYLLDAGLGQVQAYATITVKEAESSPAYEMTSGNGSSWTKGSTEGLTFKTNQDFEYFYDVMIDGGYIDDANYTAAAGSTIVTLKAAYLETLKVGEHEIAIVSLPEIRPTAVADDDAHDNYIVRGTFTVKEAGTADDEEAAADESTGANDTTKSPKTGVETAPLAATTLVFALGALVAGAFILRTRKEGVK